MIERQVIVTWHTPEERLPIEDLITVVTVSAVVGGELVYDHTFALATWCFDGEGWGWDFEDIILRQTHIDNITVHAWADLEPYGVLQNGRFCRDFGATIGKADGTGYCSDAERREQDG